MDVAAVKPPAQHPQPKAQRWPALPARQQAAIQQLLGHRWLSTTVRYVHVADEAIEYAYLQAARTGCRPVQGVDKCNGTCGWLSAAQRGISRSSDLRRLLADAGLEISAGKMSHLWSGRPISIRLDDLDVICAVLGCEPGELLIRDPDAARPGERENQPAAAASSSAIRPARRAGKSPPPV